MQKSLIILLLCITSLFAGKNEFLKSEFPSEYFFHSDERAHILLEAGTITGSQHIRLPRGNLLYDGTLHDGTRRDNALHYFRDSLAKRMSHRVTFATKRKRTTYAIFMAYEAKEKDKSWYYDTISKKRNTLLAGVSLRRELSPTRAINIALSSRTSIDRGEVFDQYKNYYYDDYWTLTYKNYNVPNVTESLDVNIGYIRYLQTKKATPLLLLHNFKWNYTLHREDNPMNSDILLYYMNNPMVEEFTIRREDWNNHHWTLRSSLFSVKRDADKLYRLDMKDGPKSFTMNLNILSFSATRSQENIEREDLVYSENPRHYLWKRKQYKTNFDLYADIDFTIFRFAYLGVDYNAHLESREWYNSKFRFNYEITPYVGLRAALSRSLFLNVKMEIITLDRQDSGIGHKSLGSRINYFYYEDHFPLTISLSYTF